MQKKLVKKKAEPQKFEALQLDRAPAPAPSAAAAVPEKMTVKRKTGIKRKSEILDTARQIIFTEGFGNFTVRTVASRIGISEAAIYRHFASKEELMLALLDFLFAPWRQEIQNLIDSGMNPTQKLGRLVELHLHHLLQKQLNPMLFFSEAIHPDNARLLQGLQFNLSFLHSAVTRIITLGQKNGEIRHDLLIPAAVSCIIGLMQTSVIKWTLARSEDGLLEEIQRNVKFFAEQITCERPLL